LVAFLDLEMDLTARLIVDLLTLPLLGADLILVLIAARFANVLPAADLDDLLDLSLRNILAALLAAALLGFLDGANLLTSQLILIIKYCFSQL